MLPFSLPESGVSGVTLICVLHLVVATELPVFSVHFMQYPTLSSMVHQARFSLCCIKETVWGYCRLIVGWCQQSDQMNVLNPSASTAVTLACSSLSLCSPWEIFISGLGLSADRYLPLVCLLKLQSCWTSFRALSIGLPSERFLLLHRTSSQTRCLSICLWKSRGPDYQGIL